MRRQAALEERRVCEQPWREMNRLFLAVVREVLPEPGTVGVELVDGSQPVQAAVASSNASATSGLVWLPQVGDLVVVAFAQGHRTMPVVLGSVYAANDLLHQQQANAFTIRHQSGSVIEIHADGTVTLTQASGAFLRMQPSGDVEMKHGSNNAEVILDANGATIAQGSLEVRANSSRVLLDANSGGGGAQIEVLPNGTVNITPGSGAQIHLGGGSLRIARDSDNTSGPLPFGVGVPDHYHQVLASSLQVTAG